MKRTSNIHTYQDARRDQIYATASFYEEVINRRRAQNRDLTVYELAIEQAAKELRETQEKHDEISKRLAAITGSISGLRHYLQTEYPEIEAEIVDANKTPLALKKGNV